MTNNQILTTGDNWRQLAEAVCFKVRYFRQFASSASPYKGRQTGVAETDPGVSIRGWGMWCLASATATSTLSSGGEGSVGDAAALDSLEASAWCSEPGSDRTHQRPSYRVGTIGGHPLLYTGIQTRLKVLGFVHSTDRIARKATVQSHGAGLSRGLVPPLPPCRPHGGWGRECARATLPRPSLAKSPAGPGRVKRVGDRSLQDHARTISAQYPPAELRFFAKQFQKNPPRCRSCWKLIAADGCGDE
jgi:hypothetical protein